MVVMLVKLFAIAIILWGCYIIYKPEILKKVIGWVKEKNNIYIVGGLRAVVGVLLLLFASSCRVPWIVFLLGSIAILSGVLIYILKKETLFKIIEWMENLKKKQLYTMATIVIVIGIVIALAA